MQSGNREKTSTGKSFGEAREVAKRNCAHAGCECHDLAPVAQGAAWGSACTRDGSARPHAQRGANCSITVRKFTVAATVTDLLLLEKINRRHQRPSLGRWRPFLGIEVLAIELLNPMGPQLREYGPD